MKTMKQTTVRASVSRVLAGVFLSMLGMGMASVAAFATYGATHLYASEPPVIIPAPRKMEMKGGLCPKGRIRYERKASIPAEGYELSLTPSGIVVRHSDAAGAFYAHVSLHHIAIVKDAKGRPSYPCLEIRDAPAFSWRGVQLDDARSWLGKDVIKRTLRQMSWYKLNVLHWHLTDDEGWRFHVPDYPKLTAPGTYSAAASRGVTMCRGVRQGEPAYSDADIREILDYAASLHITVVPEIEFPGHFDSVARAYPKFACSVKGRAPLCVGNPEALAFLERVLDRVCELFPSKIIHIGGDECGRKAWEKCPTCRAMMRREGMKDVAALQMWVTRHFTDYLAKKGRRAIGWDEIFAGGELPKATIGMFWRPYAGRSDRLANAGYDLVLCPTSHCYFDYAQGLSLDPFPYFPGRAISPERVYSFDPLKGVKPEARCHILGAQCNNWTTDTSNSPVLEWKLWPRAMALAEVLWTYPEKRDFAEFSCRANEHRRRLIHAHVNCAPVSEACSRVPNGGR